MQGFVNLAVDIGHVILIMIPLICYLAGSGFIIGSLWSIYRITRGHGRERPWTPIVGIFIGSALFSFDQVLNAANATLGSSHTASMSGLTSYTADNVDPSNIVGITPQETWLNVITLFDPFFWAYGSAIVLWSLLEAKGQAQGHRRHSPSRIIVHFVFGVILLNTDVIAPAIMSHFSS